VAEGTIVRVITRLDETCREVRDAARVIGDTELFKKMQEAQNKIKRDSTLTLALPLAPVEYDLHQSCSLQACISSIPLLVGTKELCLNPPPDKAAMS